MLFLKVLTAVCATIQKMESILQHSLFNFVVERRVRGKGRGLVHFDQPWPELTVNQNVKAEDLETHRVVKVFGLARAV